MLQRYLRCSFFHRRALVRKGINPKTAREMAEHGTEAAHVRRTVYKYLLVMLLALGCWYIGATLEADRVSGDIKNFKARVSFLERALGGCLGLNGFHLDGVFYQCQAFRRGA